MVQPSGWVQATLTCAGTDASIPQTYDRNAEYDPHYMQRSIDRYRANGAGKIILGLGAYKSRGCASGANNCWRTPDELRRHVALVPSSIAGMVFWPLAGVTIPSSVYNTLGQLSPPAARAGIRTFLRALTPFASQLDDC